MKKPKAPVDSKPAPEKSGKPERTVLSVVVPPVLKTCLDEYSRDLGVKPSTGLRMILTRHFRKRLEELDESA